IMTGRQVVNGSLSPARIGVALLAIFGALAVGLASLGLYGMVAHSVNRRRREIGVRMALGATRRGVLWLIVREGLSPVCIGAVIGLATALLSGRLLSRMLNGVGGADP